MATPFSRTLYRMGSLLLLWLARGVFRIELVGRERIPRNGRIILACNHISVVDPPLIGISIPRPVHYAAKVGIFRGVWALFFRWVNAVPVLRNGYDRAALQTMLSALQQNEAVLIFPEGTNSPSGEELPVKPGIGLLAYRSGAWIQPVRISGTEHCERGRGHLIRFILRRVGHGIRIEFGEPFNPMLRIPQDVPPREAYRLIADAAMQQIRAMRRPDFGR